MESYELRFQARFYVYQQAPDFAGWNSSSTANNAWWERMEMFEIFAYRTLAVVHFTYQNRFPKTCYCIRCVMDWKIGFTNWNAKITLLCASMVVIYYIKLFPTGAERHNGILMSLLLLVAETMKNLLPIN